MHPRDCSPEDEMFMRRAIGVAERAALVEGTGGPFGCIIVKEGIVIAEGANRVVADNDPTCHGEMVAIRAACRHLKSFRMDGCTLYTTGEPCPMCAGAIYWARIARVVYASTIGDAFEYGNFDDRPIYDDLAKPVGARFIPAVQCLREEMLDLWERYRAKTDKVAY